MRIRTVFGVLVLVAGAAFFSGRALSEDEKGGEGGEMTAEQAEAMKKWMEAATPGPQHEMLGKLAGTWDVKTTGMMGESTGTATFEKVLGGRFVRQSFEGTMMGRPFQGIGYLGYDNVKKKFVMTWMDNTGTMMSHGEGLASEDGKEVRFWGSMDEVTTGEHDKPVMYAQKTIDADHFVFEIHDLHMGMGGRGSTLVMAISYSRRK